jgi:LAO/AO transport system kinase
MSKNEKSNDFVNKSKYDLLQHIKAKSNINYSSKKLREKIKNGDRLALANAITMAESDLSKDRACILDVLNTSTESNSICIGITGVPGVGKSTFINEYAHYIESLGYKVAILAIDPSSDISKGSILGDKTRMQQIAGSKNIFIRPTPSGNNFGGIHPYTYDVIRLCKLAMYDYILVETVGVGQSEIEVSHLVDLTLLLILPNAGDELQGIKRGIVEHADIMLVNKSEDSNKEIAVITKQQYINALKYFVHPLLNWKVPVESISAINNMGINSAHQLVESFIDLAKRSSYFDENRKRQINYWLKSYIEIEIKHKIQKNIDFNDEILKLAMDSGINNENISQMVHKYFDKI